MYFSGFCDRQPTNGICHKIFAAPASEEGTALLEVQAEKCLQCATVRFFGLITWWLGVCNRILCSPISRDEEKKVNSKLSTIVWLTIPHDSQKHSFLLPIWYSRFFSLKSIVILKHKYNLVELPCKYAYLWNSRTRIILWTLLFPC